MKIRHDDLRAIWREPATDVSSERSGCLTDDEWARLLATDADDAERECAVSHIASCSACADEYSLLQPLQSWMGGVQEIHSPAEAARADRWAAWRAWWSSRRLGLAAAAAIALFVTHGALLYQLLESRGDSARLGTQLAEQESALSRAQTSVAALRESLVRATGTQAELDRLQERVARLSAPQLVAEIVDLEPRSEALVRGAADPQFIVAGRDAPAVTILNHPLLTAKSTLEVAVEGASLEARWTGRVQQEQDSAAFAMVFPAGYPAGEYVVHLFDVTRGRTPLGEYPVVIQRSAERSR
jgi:hypothetical protein